MALEDVLARIRSQQLGTTEDNRVVDRGSSATIQLNRPKAITALNNKLADPQYQQAVSQLPTEVQQALRQTDLRRIDRGQTPVNAENSIKAGVAAMTGQAVTPVSDRRGSWTSIPTNAVGDIAQIAKSIPHIPRMLVNEVRDITDGYADDRAELAERGITGPTQILNLPGIRMLPGTFVASNIAADRQSFVEDPLLNVLDVLPFATTAARGTRVVQAAEEAALAERTASTGATSIASTPRVRPLKTVATRRLDDAGNVVPNRLGDLIERGMTTTPGMALRGTFGPMARDTSRAGVLAEQSAEARAFTPVEGEIVGQTFKKFHDLRDPEIMQREYNITPERADEIGVMATRNPQSLSTLTPDEQRFVTDWDAANNTLAEYMTQRDELVRIGGEFFSPTDGKRLNRAADVVGKRVLAVFGDLEYGGKNRGIMDDIDRLAEVDPRWAQVRDLIDNDDFVGASKRVNQLQRYNGQAVGINDRRMGKIKEILQAARVATGNYDRLRKATNPARFDELINDLAGKELLRTLDERSVIPDMAAAEKFLRTGELDQIPGFNPREWAKIRGGIRRTWETLKANGHDPIFMSRVTPARADRIGVARFDGTNRSLTTARARISDVSPSLNSPHISVTAQAWDIIQSEAARQLADDISSTYGRTQQSLLDEFSPVAHALAAQRGLSDEAINALRADEISKRWMPFNPDSMLPFAGVASPMGEQVWIPRVVGETLQRMNNEGLSKMRAFSDPVTRMWRVALLPLSPRWHLYNIIGGAAMVSAEVGPQAFRHMNQAREIVRAVNEGQPLPRWVPRELERQIGLMGKEEATLALKQGGSLSRWWGQSRVGDAGRRFVQASFDLNTKFDDMYKVVAYLEGEAQAVARFKKQGMSDDTARALAAEEGIRVARSVLQDVGGMTPFERSVLRQIFPFYSWLSHLMRFAFNYPMDHPWRAAIVAKGSQILMEDMGDGASTDMLDILSWGERDELGRQQSVTLRGLNPFSDAGNLFTLAGWLGSTNPLFQTAAQALGFDAMQGGIDLYPQMNYSPETGKMTVDTGNPVQNLAINSLPQLGALFRYAGRDEDFNKLMREDPETAQRILFSGIGIPGSLRRYSAEEDLIGNELKRQQAASDATARAYRTGNLDALIPFMGEEQVRVLRELREAGEIDQFLPSNDPARLTPVGGG